MKTNLQTIIEDILVRDYKGDTYLMSTTLDIHHRDLGRLLKSDNEPTWKTIRKVIKNMSEKDRCAVVHSSIEDSVPEDVFRRLYSTIPSYT